ncbi:MAG: serine/threonine-protein phosphatase [Christensenellaceae bacterium]|nr:serine/threonine-protein phosphatase [Christensenellaceae bacterium]
MRYTIDAAVRNHIGKVRKNNEDNFYLNGSYLKRDQMDAGGFFAEISSGKRQIYAVCDGMGGERKGEEASHHVTERLLRLSDILNSESDVKTCINAFCDETNRSILQFGQSGHMGTTLVLVCFHENGCEIAHLGDSRVYLLRDKQLTCLTTDHTEVNRLQQMGLISEEEAKNHPDRNMLHKYLGMQNDELIFTPEYTPYQPKAGDRLILCSDGLTDMLTDAQIQDTVLSSRTVTTATKNLINNALDAGGRDNITAMVLSVRKCDDLPEHAPRHRKTTVRKSRKLHQDVDNSKEQLLTAGRRASRKPVMISALLVFVLAIIIALILSIGGGLSSVIDLIKSNVRIENSVQIVDETQQASSVYVATPSPVSTPIPSEQLEEGVLIEDSSATVSEQENAQTFVNELIAYGLSSYQEASPSYAQMIDFALGYAYAHADIYPQLQQEKISLPAEALAGMSNADLISSMQTEGCYCISQLQMDDILLQYFNTSVPASNDYANAVYHSGNYYVSPLWDENGSRVAVVTELIQDASAQTVTVSFEVYTYVEEEGGSSMQLSGSGSATLRQMEASHLGYQLISLDTAAIALQEESTTE